MNFYFVIYMNIINFSKRFISNYFYNTIIIYFLKNKIKEVIDACR